MAFHYNGIIAYFVVKKTKEVERERQEELRRQMAEMEVEKILQQKTKEKQERVKQIIENARNPEQMKLLKKHWIWMTVAGGSDPWIYPEIHYKGDNITLIKHGYNLPNYNLNEYYVSHNQEESEKALKRFEIDLFGKYAGKLGIGTAYIADYLIQLEPRTVSCSNYTLSISTVVDSELCQYSEVRKWLYNELRNTKIPNLDELP